jgi:hypothetical protein
LLRTVTRVGGQLRLTVLGPAGTVEGFDTLWQAAADVVPHLAGPERYVHHLFGDVTTLRPMMEACGWEISEIRPVTSVRHCTADDLWRWLWGSLPTQDRRSLRHPVTRPHDCRHRR